MADQNKIVLSDIDSQRFNEVTSDKSAATQVYDRASTNYHNSLANIGKSEMLLWQHLSEVYGLNLGTEGYRAEYDNLERRYVLRPTEPVVV